MTRPLWWPRPRRGQCRAVCAVCGAPAGVCARVVCPAVWPSEGAPCGLASPGRQTCFCTCAAFSSKNTAFTPFSHGFCPVFRVFQGKRCRKTVAMQLRYTTGHRAPCPLLHAGARNDRDAAAGNAVRCAPSEGAPLRAGATWPTARLPRPRCACRPGRGGAPRNCRENAGRPAKNCRTCWSAPPNFVALQSLNVIAAAPRRL